MALPDLIDRLEQDAAREARAIAARADDEVRGVEAATTREVDEVVAAHLARARVARAAAHQQALARARRGARAAELEARHALIARVLDRARALVPEAGASDDGRRALPAFFREARSFTAGLRVRVRCAPAAAAVLAPIVAADDGAELVADPEVGPGLVVEALDGSVTVDGTVAGRLERLAPDLAVSIAAEVDRGD
ncbi:MAG: hypothetical protein R2752_05050 [Vicinamibacterales bacterium]